MLNGADSPPLRGFVNRPRLSSLQYRFPHSGALVNALAEISEHVVAITHREGNDGHGGRFVRW